MAEANGVKIVGYLNVPGRIAASASALYARNLYAFVETLIDKATKTLAVNWDDELVKATNLTRDGKVVHPAFAGEGSNGMSELTPEQAAAIADAARQAAEAAQNAADVALDAARAGGDHRRRRCGAGRARARPAGRSTRSSSSLAIFVLAIFVGYYVVWSVTPALHTPLMSVTNAISSVIVVGALLAVSVSLADAVSSGHWWARTFGFLGAGARLGQHLRRLPRHPAHARHVQEEDAKSRRAPMLNANLTALLYLVAGVLFILALRGLSNPETSRQGNTLGMAGMAIAIVTTLARRRAGLGRRSA